MKRSTDRFLTTHTGSLPRPDDLVRMMYAKEAGVPVDPARWRRACVRRWPRWCASRSPPASIIVNDGEMSKPSYATYVKDRLAGFGGTGNTFVYQDLADFPVWPSACSAIPGAHAARRRPATRPISVRDPAAAARRRRKSQGRARSRDNGTDAFMSAASPGVVSLFFRNDHYPSQEAYLLRHRGCDADEYETVAECRHRAADRLSRSRAWDVISSMRI